MRITAEQQAVVDAATDGKNTSGRIKCNALAGTGKTSTLVALANVDQVGGLYMAFNKSTAAEAASRFPKSVQCKTSHSLAYRFASGKRYPVAKLTGKLNAHEIVRKFGLITTRFHSGGSVSERAQAMAIAETYAAFCQSSATSISGVHVPEMRALHHSAGKEERIAFRKTIANRAQRLWNEASDISGAAPLGHDGYFKLWSLACPDLGFSRIMLDEAQDSNDALLHVLRAQNTQLILVGDRHQQIYEWRGAVNAMESVESHLSLYLSQSWRFGDAIARRANQVLDLLGSEVRVKGNPALSGRMDPPGYDAILCRTNLGLVGRVMEAFSDAQPFHVLGGTSDLRWMLEDVTRLKQHLPATHPEFIGFPHWNAVEKFCESPEGRRLKPFVTCVNQYGELQIIDALSCAAPSENADVLTLTTCHKAKGREWPNVLVDADFSEPAVIEEQELERVPEDERVIKPGTDEIYRYSGEEARLLYVALTRAKAGLTPPPWFESFFGAL